MPRALKKEPGTAIAKARKKYDYSEDFNKLWSCFGYTQKAGLGSRGFKSEAWIEYQRVDERPEVDVLISALRNQAKEKLLERKKTGRDPQSFKHVCRWLKYRCWEGDEDLAEIPDFQEEKRDVIARITDRSWAD